MIENDENENIDNEKFDKVDEDNQKSAVSKVLEYLSGFILFSVIDILFYNLLIRLANDKKIALIIILALAIVGITFYAFKKSRSKFFKNGVLLSVYIFIATPLMIMGSCLLFSR